MLSHCLNGPVPFAPVAALHHFASYPCPKVQRNASTPSLRASRRTSRHDPFAGIQRVAAHWVRRRSNPGSPSTAAGGVLTMPAYHRQLWLMVASPLLLSRSRPGCRAWRASSRPRTSARFRHPRSSAAPASLTPTSAPRSRARCSIDTLINTLKEQLAQPGTGPGAPHFQT